jgi:hypothetical protein
MNLSCDFITRHQSANPTPELEFEHYPELTSAVLSAVSRVAKWPTPLGWSFREWLEEARQTAFLAAFEALRDSLQFQSVELGAFLYQRICGGFSSDTGTNGRTHYVLRRCIMTLEQIQSVM